MKTDKKITARIRKIIRKSLGCSYSRIDIRRVCSNGESLMFDFLEDYPISISELRNAVWDALEYLMVKNGKNYCGKFVCDPWVDEKGNPRIIVRADPDMED